MPRAKQRAAFYAKHNRVPRPAGNGVTSSHAAGSSPAVVPNSSASPTVRLGSGMLRPHRGGSAKHPGGPYSSASLHQQQFANVLLVWETVRPLLLAFSPVLQDLARSTHSAELELGSCVRLQSRQPLGTFTLYASFLTSFASFGT